VAHIRQSWPDSGLGLQVKGLNFFQVVPLSFGSGAFDKREAFDKRDLTNEKASSDDALSRWRQSHT